MFAQFIQASHGKLLYGMNTLLSNPDSIATTACPITATYGYRVGWMRLTAAPTLCSSALGPGDFLVHHAIALGLHTTTLILVKGALDARGSKLMPDKKDFGYAFPCDGRVVAVRAISQPGIRSTLPCFGC